MVRRSASQRDRGDFAVKRDRLRRVQQVGIDVEVTRDHAFGAVTPRAMACRQSECSQMLRAGRSGASVRGTGPYGRPAGRKWRRRSRVRAGWAGRPAPGRSPTGRLPGSTGRTARSGRAGRRCWRRRIIAPVHRTARRPGTGGSSAGSPLPSGRCHEPATATGQSSPAATLSSAWMFLASSQIRPTLMMLRRLSG